MKLEQTWRWFGPEDRVTLRDAHEAGAEAIVTALHEIPAGEVWSVQSIRRRQQEVEAAGLRWSVVESLDVTEAVKTREGPWREHTDAFIQSLRNLAECGITTVAYNFMPLFSWMRTDLRVPAPSGGFTTRFDATAFAAFDLFLLRREGAEEEWGAAHVRAAEQWLRLLSESERDALQMTILNGLPGGNGRWTLEGVRRQLAIYAGIDETSFRANAREFLQAVCPVAEELGVRLCVHPDDPPRPLLGLPRIVSTGGDLAWLMEQWPGEANSITFCTGALGVRADNDLLAMLRRFAPRIGFFHLRSTQRYRCAVESPESFFEAPHLEGDANLIALLHEIVRSGAASGTTGSERTIPFRPDHGQELLNDVERGAFPGYPAVGRLRGLAELRGALRMAERIITAC